MHVFIFPDLVVPSDSVSSTLIFSKRFLSVPQRSLGYITLAVMRSGQRKCAIAQSFLPRSRKLDDLIFHHDHELDCPVIACFPSFGFKVCLRTVTGFFLDALTLAEKSIFIFLVVFFEYIFDNDRISIF